VLRVEQVHVVRHKVLMEGHSQRRGRLPAGVTLIRAYSRWAGRRKAREGHGVGVGAHADSFKLETGENEGNYPNTVKEAGDDCEAV